MAPAKKKSGTSGTYDSRATSEFARNIASSPMIYGRVTRMIDGFERDNFSKSEARDLLAAEFSSILSKNYYSMTSDYPLLYGVVPDLDGLGVDVGKAADKFLQYYGPRPSVSKCVKRTTTGGARKSTSGASGTRKKSTGSSQRKPAKRRC